MTTIRLPAELPGAEATETPKIAGTCRGTVIICGTGPTLWDDLRQLEHLEADLMAVNFAGVFLPEKPQHWVSLHPEHFQWKLPLRHDVTFDHTGLRMGRPIHTHSIQHCAGVMHVWPKSMVPPGSGGSGLAACRISLFLGYERGILAGMPLDGYAHFYDPPGYRTGTEFEHMIAPLKAAAKSEFHGRITSMSGKTRELLGAPTLKGA